MKNTIPNRPRFVAVNGCCWPPDVVKLLPAPILTGAIAQERLSCDGQQAFCSC